MGMRHWHLFYLGLLAALSLFIIPSASAQSSANDNVQYTFKRGDTLIQLSQKYLRRPADYRAVQRLNRIANPRFIPVGKTVSIPYRLLKYRPSKASLVAYRGRVTIAAEGKTVTPAKNIGLGEGSNISTAAGSFMTLQMEDGSRVSMPSNSKLRISRLRHILLTDSIDYEFTVDNGRIQSKIIPFTKKADRYRVRTPVAVSAVRGTDYRTRVDETTGTAFSETVEGSVEVSAGKQIVSIPAGTGAAASVTGDLDKANLLTPPELFEPAKVQSEGQLMFKVEPRIAALAHRVLISTDAGFVDIVAEQKSEGNLIMVEGLEDGRYFAKATSFDAKGFEGMPAAYSFKRQLSTLSGSAGKTDFGYRFKWAGAGKGTRLYRFQLLRGSKDSLPIVDETGLTQDVITMSDLPDGEYFWRVGVTQFSGDPEDPEPFQKWTDFEKLTVAG